MYRRLGGPQGRSGRTGKSRPHWDSILDRPARSQSQHRLIYPVHTVLKQFPQINTPVVITLGMNWFIAVGNQRLFASALPHPSDWFLGLEQLLCNYISNKTHFTGYSWGGWEIRRLWFCETQWVPSRIFHSPTLRCIVSYNTATERRHTNDGNEIIRSLPISVTLFTFHSSMPPLFKVTKFLRTERQEQWFQASDAKYTRSYQKIT